MSTQYTAGKGYVAYPAGFSSDSSAYYPAAPVSKNINRISAQQCYRGVFDQISKWTPGVTRSAASSLTLKDNACNHTYCERGGAPLHNLPSHTQQLATHQNFVPSQSMPTHMAKLALPSLPLLSQCGYNNSDPIQSTNCTGLDFTELSVVDSLLLSNMNGGSKSSAPRCQLSYMGTNDRLATQSAPPPRPNSSDRLSALQAILDHSDDAFTQKFIESLLAHGVPPDDGNQAVPRKKRTRRGRRGGKNRRRFQQKKEELQLLLGGTSPRGGSSNNVNSSNGVKSLLLTGHPTINETSPLHVGQQGSSMFETSYFDTKVAASTSNDGSTVPTISELLQNSLLMDILEPEGGSLSQQQQIPSVPLAQTQSKFQPSCSSNARSIAYSCPIQPPVKLSKQTKNNNSNHNKQNRAKSDIVSKAVAQHAVPEIMDSAALQEQQSLQPLQYEEGDALASCQAALQQLLMLPPRPWSAPGGSPSPCYANTTGTPSIVGTATAPAAADDFTQNFNSNVAPMPASSEMQNHNTAEACYNYDGTTLELNYLFQFPLCNSLNNNGNMTTILPTTEFLPTDYKRLNHRKGISNNNFPCTATTATSLANVGELAW